MIRKFAPNIFSIPWYPFILGIYPPIALFASNVSQVDFGVIFRPLVISMAGSALLFFLIWLLIRDVSRAAFLSATLTLLFFIYGHLYNYVEDITVWGVPVGRHRVLLIFYVFLIILSIIFALRKGINFSAQNSSVNAIAIVLLIFPIYTIISYRFSVDKAAGSVQQAASTLEVKSGQSLPDVYYIILDSYTRSDVLSNVYGYDNSAFINDLENMGFYVADCSTSNYMWTHLSISSTLNMQYLQDIPAYDLAEDKDILTEELIKHSLVRNTFEGLGYKTVAFATGFPFNEISDADLYLQPPYLMESIREFDALLVETTLLRVFQDFGLIRINQTATALYRDRTLFALSQFDDLARLGGPKFVYIHIIPPHPPFVFGPNGEVVMPRDFLSTEGQYTNDKYDKGYIDQVNFISKQITVSLQQLLSESSIPPIIIVQGDHGPWLQEGENRISILNAYYLPKHTEGIYPEISPVNSFRVIFNKYFQADYALLGDVSYASSLSDVYELSLQPSTCKK